MRKTGQGEDGRRAWLQLTAGDGRWASAHYWTLRTRAETSWCQSRSLVYLGPMTWEFTLVILVPGKVTGGGRKEERKKEKGE